MIRWPLVPILLILFTTFGYANSKFNPKIRIGAKHFNEGYILSEIVAILLEDAGFEVERMYSLGGTAVIFEALRTGEIDVYPEYTGTISQEIFKASESVTSEEQRKRLKDNFGLEITAPLGFNNTYALVMMGEKAQQLGIKNISHLQDHSELRIGLSYEFLKRQDGWSNLSKFYKLPQKATGLEHGLAYQAILNNNIDVTDAYSTDGEIIRQNLQLLHDDKNFFPDYEAVLLYTATLPDEAKVVFSRLASSISEKEMQSMNASALFENKSFYEIAYQFLAKKNMIKNEAAVIPSFWREIFQKTLEHINLTLLALLSAMAIAVPVGMLIYKYRKLSRTVLYLAGILQTIPSIALLALMIPMFGIGFFPAMVALFIYALLPILRNTVIGLFSVDPELKKVGTAIGLNDWKRLRYVELPLAMPAILTGIRTAAVINVGTATLAAFIGAGGLGEFIVTGLALNNMNLILMGAIPSAILAIIFELIFELIEWKMIPRHLRQKV